MNTKKLSLTLLFILSVSLIIKARPVEKWLSIGPLPVSNPGFIKGKNINGEKFDAKFVLMNRYMDLLSLQPEEAEALLWDDFRPRTWSVKEVDADGFLQVKREKPEMQIAYHAFYIESEGLYYYSCEVESPQMFDIFLDGKKLGSSYKTAEKNQTNKKTVKLDLDRGKYLVMVKSLYIRSDENKWKLKASVSNGRDSTVILDVTPDTRMNIHHLLEGCKLGRVSLSPDGTLIAINYSRVNTETGKTDSWMEIKEASTGMIVQSFRKAGTSGYRWMPSGRKLYYTSTTENGSTVMVYDFESGAEYPVLEQV
jgi:hypothetical protein